MYEKKIFEAKKKENSKERKKEGKCKVEDGKKTCEIVRKRRA